MVLRMFNVYTVTFVTVPCVRAGVMLMVFMFFLPGILALMNRFAGMVSVSRIDFAVVEKFFVFQLLTVFLATALAGTLLAQVAATTPCSARAYGRVCGATGRTAAECRVPWCAVWVCGWRHDYALCTMMIVNLSFVIIQTGFSSVLIGHAVKEWRFWGCGPQRSTTADACTGQCPCHLPPHTCSFPTAVIPALPASAAMIGSCALARATWPPHPLTGYSIYCVPCACAARVG
jgi:hypothetical protein